MFDKVWDFVLKKLYERAALQSSKEISQNQKDAQEYYDITHENITAIVANALSILAFGDSSVTIDLNGESTKRTEYLNNIAVKEFTRAKRKITAALGVGMIASIPYCTDNGLGRRIYIDTITKDRFYITGVQGDEITEITALADTFITDTEKYLRWTDYSVKDGIYTIRNKATNMSGSEIPLTKLKQWENIQPEIHISGVDRLPVAFYSCPAGERRPDSIEGVPITYGCGATLEKIEKVLADIEKEFKNKGVRVFASRSLLMPQRDKDGKIIGKELNDDLYVKTSSTSDDDTITVFDPAIRESSYFTKLAQHFAMLEKEIGCSKGILTDLVTNGATATEIRRSMNATFCLTDDMRKEYVKYFDTLIYSVNILCNYYNLTPMSEYNINFDWNYSLVEDSEQTFKQLLEGKAQGAVSTLEIRRFLKPDETPEEAQKAIDEIRMNEPSLNSLLGMDEGSAPPGGHNDAKQH